MKIVVNGHDSPSGCVSQISWENERLLSCLNEIFCVRSNERITELHINDTFLTAVFETDTTPKKEAGT